MTYEEIIEWLEKEKTEYINLTKDLLNRQITLENLVSQLIIAINALEKLDK